MEVFDDVSGERMGLARFAVAVVAGIAQVERFVLFHFGLKGSPVANDGFPGNLLEANSADS